MTTLPLLLVEDDEDLLMLSLERQPKTKGRVYYNQVKVTKPFILEDLTDDYCWIHFRFFKKDIIRLKQVFGIPDMLTCKKSVVVGGTEALCILLKRFAYPNRYHDLMTVFPRTRCEISRILSQLLIEIPRNHGHKLRTLNRPWLRADILQMFTEALVNKGCPYHECFGFLDGTVRSVCRPKNNQRQYYNGHKRTHALKYQSVLVPNGLIAHLGGPVVGRRHDGFLLQDSGLVQQLEALPKTPDGRPYHLYGDPAYPLLPNLITPFKSHNLTPEKAVCNKRMSSIRESVEWGFAKLIQKFAFLDYKKNIKIGKQPVHSYYTVCVLLLNCHTCIYNSQAGIYFDCNPPTLEEYMM